MAEPTGVEAPVEDAGAEGVALGELEGDNVPSEYTSETPAEAGQTATRRPVTTGQAGGLGRRKEAIARVRLVPGTGQWKINGRPLDAYFPNKVHQQIVSEPFVTLGAEGQFDVVALITGGGVTGQAGALRLGVARALILIDPELAAEDGTDGEEAAPSEYTTESPEAAAPRAARRPVVTGHASGLGRRKEAIARVRIVPGTGQWKINGRTLDAYFPNKVHQQIVSEPFVTLGAEGNFDVIARIGGGGVSG